MSVCKRERVVGYFLEGPGLHAQGYEASRLMMPAPTTTRGAALSHTDTDTDMVEVEREVWSFVFSV